MHVNVRDNFVHLSNTELFVYKTQENCKMVTYSHHLH